MIILAIRTLLLITLLAIGVAFNPATANDDQRLFKAAFIYNFAKFTRWPETSDVAKSSEIRLCTLGDDQLVNDLTRLKGKIIQDRSLVVKPLNDPNECDMLYIAASRSNDYLDILIITKEKPILTISEIKHFAQAGGIIELNHEKGQTHITANISAAHDNKLELSSRLLMLSNIVTSNDAR